MISPINYEFHFKFLIIECFINYLLNLFRTRIAKIYSAESIVNIIHLL